MSLGRGPEVLLHPEMNLHGFTFEPATAARGEFRGFGSFGKLEHVAIELSRTSFAARRHRELYVIYSDDGHDRLRAILPDNLPVTPMICSAIAVPATWHYAFGLQGRLTLPMAEPEPRVMDDSDRPTIRAVESFRGARGERA